LRRGAEGGAVIESVHSGVDLGGTKIAVGLVTSSGKIIDKTVLRDHRGKPEDETVAAIAGALQALFSAHAAEAGSVTGIGVGSSGHVDYARGTVITNSNLPGFSNFPIAEKLQAAMNLPVIVDNDANAQAYAEYVFGAGRGEPNMAFVTISTGIGAGIIIDGKVYRGTTGTAGEIGHTIVNTQSSLRCGCGNYGCLMAHASGLALPQVVRQKLARPGVETSIDFSGFPDSAINGELIKAGFDAGDVLCTEIVYEYADYLAVGLQNTFQVLNPGVIVVGGGLTAWGDRFIERIRRSFYRFAGSMMTERMEIRVSSIGADAGLVGAAALTLQTKGNSNAKHE